MEGQQKSALSAQTSPPAHPQTVFWVIAVLLAVIATTLVLRVDDALLRQGTAVAQTSATPVGPRMGARGISAFIGQLTRNSYGLFMIDVDTGTVWCYEVGSGGDGAKQLRLVAARSWVYDRYLEEYNVTDPTPSAVRALVAQQMQNQTTGDTAALPTSAPAGAGSDAGPPASR